MVRPTQWIATKEELVELHKEFTVEVIATMLGFSERTIYKKLREFGITKKKIGKDL